MGRKKPRKPRNGRTSEQSMTRRGLRIYQKGDQIKTLTGHRWDVASQSEEGVRYGASFATVPRASAPTTPPERGAGAST